MRSKYDRRKYRIAHDCTGLHWITTRLSWIALLVVLVVVVVLAIVVLVEVVVLLAVVLSSSSSISSSSSSSSSISSRDNSNYFRPGARRCLCVYLWRKDEEGG